MIFVLIGIIILVVSFIVALVSLIREQAKFEHQALDLDQDKESVEKVDEEPQVNGVSQDSDVVLATGKLHYDLIKEQRITQEQFFWEKPEYKNANLQDQDSEIESIRREIERKIEENKSKENTKLSGEVSIADLKKDLSEG